MASLHRGTNGPALATLITNKATEAGGSVSLIEADRAALRANGLSLVVRAMENPQQVQRAPLRVVP